jgi:indolepyruvate ferredoxin oxidoreductase
MNLSAFVWGRRAAVDEQAVRALIGAKVEKRPETFDELVARRVDFLTAYQDAAYAESYRGFVARVRATSEPLALAVARNLFKLMAYKDEYEVARLYSGGAFAANLAKQFKGDFKLKFHLAPPVLGRTDAFSGKPVKTEFGPAMMSVFKLLAKLKRLRGTPFDVFGKTAERRMERQLILDYRRMIEGLLADPARANSATALELAGLPDMIRGFGHVKEASVAKARLREAELLSVFNGAPAALKTAAE